MGVHFDACASGLLQQVVQVTEIVPADQNGGTFLDAQIDFGGFGMAVGLRIGRIEKRHGAHTDLSGAHHEVEQFAAIGIVFCGGSQRLLHERHDLGVLFAQHIRVIIIGRDTLEPDDDQLAKRAPILIQIAVGDNTRHRAVADPRVHRVLFGFPGRRLRNRPVKGLAVGRPIGRLKALAQGIPPSQSLLTEHIQRLGIKAHIGDGGKEPLGDKVACLGIFHSDLAGELTPDRDTLEQINQQVLQRRNLGRLATHAAHRATGAASRFFALKAKHLHGQPSFVSLSAVAILNSVKSIPPPMISVSDWSYTSGAAADTAQVGPGHRRRSTL